MVVTPLMIGPSALGGTTH
jgi:hypothetical protein